LKHKAAFVVPLPLASW